MTLREHLQREEGFVPHAYQDPLGFWTIGFGRLIDQRRGGGISRDEAEMLLDHDIAAKTAELRARAPWTEALDTVRREALVALAFQLGVGGLLGFRRALAAMQCGDWGEARREFLESEWARQTPDRARRVTHVIATGQWGAP